MADGCSKQLPRPGRRSVRWTSFVASEAKGRISRGLEEDVNPSHRARVEHNARTLFVHISGEAGPGWTTLVIDRPTREWAIAQRRRQQDAAQAAYDLLYGETPEPS